MRRFTSSYISQLIQNPQIPGWLDSHSLCWRKDCGSNLLALHLNCHNELPKLITWHVQLRSYFSNFPNHHISKNSYDTKCNGASFLTQNLNLCLFTKLCSGISHGGTFALLWPSQAHSTPWWQGPIKLICATRRPGAMDRQSRTQAIYLLWLSHDCPEFQWE